MAVLELQGLEKSFGALVATSAVDLTVEPGEIHALIGPNGAGKTTLISQIYGSLAPDRGRILLKGEDITRLATHQRVRKGIGRSFQITTVLMDFTAADNAAVAVIARQDNAFGMIRPAASNDGLREAAMEVLARVGLAERGPIKASDLSHGERRLLELGLALAAQPGLLLLDEPMAGTGPEETARMAEIIASLKGEAAILLIEHDMDAVFRLADRITVMVEGAVIATGTPAEISANAAVQEAYLGDSSLEDSGLEDASLEESSSGEDGS